MSQAPALNLGQPIQIAYAVPDVRAAARKWVQSCGAGPFLVRTNTGLQDVNYRGEPAAFDHTSAYGQWGSLMLELVQDHQTERTPIRQMYEPHESGLHHLAFAVESLERTTERLSELGFEVAMSATTKGGTEFRFIDASASHGHMFELYANSARLARFYDRIREASVGWDGQCPFVG